MSADVPRPRARRRWLRGLLLVGALLLGTAAVLVVPRWRGVRLWMDLTGDEALDPGARGLFAVPLPPPADPAAPWQPKVWIARFPDVRGAPGSQPGLLFAHGLAAEGLGDERIQRVVHALGRAGFLVLAPEIASLRWPGHYAPDIADLAGELARLDAPDLAPLEADPRRHGAMGVSLGGALLLRALAHHIREGGVAPRAVLLIGVPYDLEPLLALWSGPPPATWTAAQVEEHRFARSGVLMAAVPGLFHDDEHVRRTLLAWLATAWVPPDLPALDDERALEFARHVQDPTVAPAWRDRVRAAAWERLGPLSLAQHADELVALKDVEVFLVHGRGDALIPAAQMEALARHLPRARPLLSGLLGHADLGEASLAERWAHVTWVDDFLDAIDG